MSTLRRIPTEDFDRHVSAVAMNERFILVGTDTGVLSTVYNKNGVKVFAVKLTEAAITAVCCEEQPEYSNAIFYAGDTQGNLFTVNQKGLLVAQTKLNRKKGEIHTIMNKNKFTLYAYTTTGHITFSHATSDFRKGHFSKESSNFSLDGDGTLHNKKGAGDFGVHLYNCKTPTNVVATCAIEFGKMEHKFRQVYAYGVFDHGYESMIEEGTAERSLPVYCSQHKLIRALEFPSPPMQVMSCRHHVGNAEEDKVYILLWNGSIYKAMCS